MAAYVINHVEAAVKRTVQERINNHIIEQKEAKERLSHLKAK